MQRLQAVLRQRLKKAAKVAVLGIGSELRADDVAGVIVAEHVTKLTKGKKIHARLKVFVGGTAPENCTGQIKRFKPEHIVIIDAADLDAKPGKVAVLAPNEISGVSFCTHSLPITVMVDYLRQFFACDITLIGIQPKSLAMGATASEEVLRAAESVATAIARSLA